MGSLVLSFVLFSSCGTSAPDPATQGPLRLFSLDGIAAFPPPTHVGEVLAFAFPRMRNTGDEPVEILRFELLHVPSGVQVVKYRLLNSRDLGGFWLGSFPPSQRGVEGFDQYPDYLPKHPQIAPHKVSQYYGAVYTRLTHKTAAYASGCQVYYRYRGKTYRAVGGCRYFFQPAPGS